MADDINDTNDSGTSNSDSNDPAAMVALIDAALLGRLTNQEDSIKILGREIRKIPIPDLMELRRYYASLAVAGNRRRVTQLKVNLV